MKNSVYAPIDPVVRALLGDEEKSSRQRLHAFEKLKREPTVAEIAFDFFYGDYAEERGPDGEWCLEPIDAVYVLLRRIEELEKPPEPRAEGVAGTIRIEEKDGKLELKSPYAPGLAAEARKLGGRFSFEAKVWRFDKRDLERVRRLCMQTYGMDDRGPDKVVTVRISFTKQRDAWDREHSLFLGGRELVRIFGRDSGASLGEGVVLISGQLWSGGSRKTPAINWKEGTVLELRDVPEAMAREYVDQGWTYGTVEIVDGTHTA